MVQPCSFLVFANQLDILQACCEVTSLETSCYLEGTSNLQLLGSALSIPQPQAERSPGQSTKWLFATKNLEMPESSPWPICQSRLPHSHTVIHTALRRLCQQARPNWAQLLSLHLQRVQGGETPAAAETG